MDEIIKTLVKIIPIAEWLQSLGLSETTSDSLASVFYVVFASIALGVIALLKNKYIVYRNAKDLAPYYRKIQIKERVNNYIETRYQNQSPTLEAEPGFSHKFVADKKLIPFFINTVFNENKEADTFYMILADSGMGKTTFMINLYLRYHSLLNFRRKYKMKFFPFGDSDALESIKKIKAEEAKHTILLLDAFDEDSELQKTEKEDGLTDDKRFRQRFDKIMKAVKGFREVVITCRSQYFPGHEKEHYELNIRRFDDKGFHKLAKLYVSCFDNKDIKRFLNKKYGVFRFWELKKKRKATQVVSKSRNLMVRPMLLSYIDFFVNSEKDFKNTFDIYESLVEQWLDREAIKRKQESKIEEFKRNLLDFSVLVAREIYNNRVEHSSLSVSIETAKRIKVENKINLEDYEVTGQSLLTKDAAGNWKFAHKSIFEFFIAKWAIENKEALSWTSLDMAKEFYQTKILENFVLVSTDGRKELEDFCICKYQVTQKEWKAVMGINPGRFKGDNNPVENVPWNEARDYIKKLNEKTGLKYRLPTENEWEFAARGGLKSKGFEYSGSDNIDKVAWNSGNSEYQTHPVGELEANELGIFDMSGNVWEWTSTEVERVRIIRGGSCDDVAEYCRVVYRRMSHPGNREDYIGFRLALGL